MEHENDALEEPGEEQTKNKLLEMMHKEEMKGMKNWWEQFCLRLSNRSLQYYWRFDV